MTYQTVVSADTPLHWYRCSDTGGGILHDVGAGPQRALMTSGGQAQLAYTGPSSDGGSVWMDSNVFAWHNEADQLQSTPFTFECVVWRHLHSGLVEVLMDWFAELQITATATVAFSPRAGFTVSTPATISEQAWHHLVATYGPTGGTKLYVDGVNVVTNASFIVAANGGHAIAVGGSAAGANQAHANLAECAFYQAELSAAQVTAHFNALDLLAQKPVSLQNGTINLTTGVPIFTGTSLAAILAAVTRTY